MEKEGGASGENNGATDCRLREMDGLALVGRSVSLPRMPASKLVSRAACSLALPSGRAPETIKGLSVVLSAEDRSRNSRVTITLN